MGSVLAAARQLGAAWCTGHAGSSGDRVRCSWRLPQTRQAGACQGAQACACSVASQRAAGPVRRLALHSVRLPSCPMLRELQQHSQAQLPLPHPCFPCLISCQQVRQQPEWEGPHAACVLHGLTGLGPLRSLLHLRQLDRSGHLVRRPSTQRRRTRKHHALQTQY